MEKIIGTHNTMSYLPPMRWWQKPINWLSAQCQFSFTANFDEAIDVRLVWDKKESRWNFAHGLVTYKNRTDIVTFFDNKVQIGAKYIRLILERNGGEAQFQMLCKYLKKRYEDKDVVFIGGYRKSDWKKLYDFGTNDIPIHQWVGSMADDARWYERFIPWHYAKRMNKKNMENLKEGINLFDFL